VKVVKVGNSIRIAIQAVFSKALGILEGDTVHLESTDHEILARKLESRKKGTAAPTDSRAHHATLSNPGGPTTRNRLLTLKVVLCSEASALGSL
jgi:antitoxin component of MazEF toxin-antitoxin module